MRQDLTNDAGPGRVASRSSDERVINASRVAVVAGSLLVFLIDPSGDPSRRAAVFVVLGLYLLHAIGTYSFERRSAKRWFSPYTMTWVDLGWVTVLMAVSNGTSSVFTGLYSFVIVCAAFQGGFKTGLPVVVAAVLATSIAGTLTAPSGVAFELDRTLIRPLYLAVLGYLVTYWGEHEVRQRRKLALLREVTALSNPRFGIDHTIGKLLAQLRSFHRADECRLVVLEPNGSAWTRVAREGDEAAGAPVALPLELARRLLPLPQERALLHCDAPSTRPWPRPRLLCAEVLPGARAHWEPGRAAEGADLAAALGAASFVSAPFQLGPEVRARIYASTAERRAYRTSEVEFLVHVVQQVAPVLENIRLVDRLASDAARVERQRLGLDVHDSVIQPYIGVRLGLASVTTALRDGRVEDATRDARRLEALVEEEIAALRGYVRRLSSASPAYGTPALPVLAGALQRTCQRFTQSTGIEVGLDVTPPPVTDRLAAEVVQMVCEALSNVRRHSRASRADVKLQAVEGRLRLEVRDDGAEPAGVGFLPRSLSDRAAALGGVLQVHRLPGATQLRIEIPL